MALIPIAVPPFPNVPNFPGVPPLNRAPSQIVSSIIGTLPGGQILQQLLGAAPAIQWGIFTDQGDPVITGDSTISFEFSKDMRISDFPVEQGGFASYNKVEVPFDVKMTFATTARADFLLAIEPQLLSLDLFTAVTPDKTYTNCNIVHYDYRRTAESGVSLLTVDVWLKEVRETAETQFTQTQAPQGEATQSNGTVQSTPVASVVAQERALKAGGETR